MTATVTKLPTASASFYEFRQKSPGLWQLDLVTPSPGFVLKGYRSALVAGHDREAILDHARQSAEAAKRPLKMRKGA
ncbi:hypothetical protein [Sinorhizobium fredii]|uniref:hypothetical protein n=1 Tax=Rhizobium fredii TaxID=380 RepID=UPI0004B544DB|nr:hypothetical protein [Sinorhizobium fredii]ASY69740.1 hypothetical protein SF83666_c23240 [Sinorhizobium fredii CCBAU 83666]